MPRVLDGAAIAAAIKQEVAEEVVRLAHMGFDQAWPRCWSAMFLPREIYVPQQSANLCRAGLFSELITPPDTVTTEEMLDIVAALNGPATTSIGILIQLPLPKTGRRQSSARCCFASKDVDGFHP